MTARIVTASNHAILIDVGGVLSSGYTPESAGRWGARLGITPEEFLRAIRDLSLVILVLGLRVC
jgi:hypothetical protein